MSPNKYPQTVLQRAAFISSSVAIAAYFSRSSPQSPNYSNIWC